jgi:hypothetical protein
VCNEDETAPALSAQKKVNQTKYPFPSFYFKIVTYPAINFLSEFVLIT